MLPVQNMLQDAVGIAEMLVAHGERSIKLVNVDMPRTFGHHPLFQPGAEGTERTTEVLEAYICYRPDLGYVQGMSYLAATLCFHMDSFTAFKALVALMSSSLLFDMFRLEATRVRGREDKCMHLISVTLLTHVVSTNRHSTTSRCTTRSSSTNYRPWQLTSRRSVSTRRCTRSIGTSRFGGVWPLLFRLMFLACPRCV